MVGGSRDDGSVIRLLGLTNFHTLRDPRVPIAVVSNSVLRLQGYLLGNDVCNVWSLSSFMVGCETRCLLLCGPQGPVGAPSGTFHEEIANISEVAREMPTGPHKKLKGPPP